MKNIFKEDLTEKDAKELGFTHHAKLYGVNIWYNINTSDVRPKREICDKLLDFFIYLEITFEFNEEGFPIVLKKKL